jgi:hypothetical protein
MITSEFTDENMHASAHDAVNDKNCRDHVNKFRSISTTLIKIPVASNIPLNTNPGSIQHMKYPTQENHLWTLTTFLFIQPVHKRKFQEMLL